MPFPSDFYTYLSTHTLTGIKGGPDRKTFLEIWMVEVDQRVFARSWNKSERSWFTAIRDTGVGEIQYGDQTVPITGKVVPHTPELTGRINAAYLSKYDQPANVKYAEGITQPEYATYTMEFFPKSSSD